MFHNNYRVVQSYFGPSIISALALMLDFGDCLHRYHPRAVPILAHVGDILDFPYLCSIVVHDQFIGTCTIIQKNYVFTSASNMDSYDVFKPREEGSNVLDDQKFQNLEGFKVFAASESSYPIEFSKRKYIVRAVKAVAMIPNFNKDDIIYPQNKDFRSKLVRDSSGGFEYNICFLEVDDFKWDRDLLPIYLKYSRTDHSILDHNFMKYTEEKIKALERDPFTNSSCRIAGWHKPTKRIIYHHVTYIPRAECQQAYCGKYMQHCNRFPIKEYHVCFKSLFFVEPCASDTGAVLYCDTDDLGFKNFAVLTTSMSCADSSLPSVYTTMPSLVEGYIKVAKKPYEMDKHVFMGF